MTLLLIQSCHCGSSGSTEAGSNGTNSKGWWPKFLGWANTFCTFITFSNTIQNFIYG
uniref:MEG-10 n=1 Tax=Schistosoma mansoni TaxID=6183 RepID=A0A3Q0KQ39_SCHMA